MVAGPPERIGKLTDDDLTKTVLIRGQPLLVHEACIGPWPYELPCGPDRIRRARDLRQLALPSIPLGIGGYNANPQYEKAAAPPVLLA
jgi:hypothetical protein